MSETALNLCPSADTQPLPSPVPDPALPETAAQTSDPPPVSEEDNPGWRRHGKVASKPKHIRDRINQMLLDGFTYERIIAELGEDGRDLNKMNLSNWKKGGHQDWLKQQRLLDECRIRNELAIELAREDTNFDAFSASQKMTAALICQTLAEYGPDTLREACKANPLNLIRLIHALPRLTLGGIRCERHQADQAERKAKAEKENQCQTKKGLSPETVQELTQKLKLM